MEVVAVLIRIYNEEDYYICSVLLNPDCDEIMYYSMHSDIDKDEEILRVYLDGLNYACDIYLLEEKLNFPLQEGYETYEEFWDKICYIIPKKYKELVKEKEKNE